MQSMISRHKSRIFCELCSQKTPRGMLPSEYLQILFYFSHTNTQNKININAAPPKISATVSDAFNESQIIPLRSSFVIGGFWKALSSSGTSFSIPGSGTFTSNSYLLLDGSPGRICHGLLEFQGIPSTSILATV